MRLGAISLAISEQSKSTECSLSLHLASYNFLKKHEFVNDSNSEFTDGPMTL